LIGFEPGRLVLDASSFQGDLGGGVLGLQSTGSTVNVTFTPNRGPLASPVEYTRLRGASLRIRLSHLATNWSDLDGDGVALNSIALTSATGGRVTTNGTFIFYEPASDAPDTIAYTIRDLRTYRAGDTVRTANGIIHLAAATDAPEQSLNIVWAGLLEGNPVIKFAGIPGYTYEVQRSTNLSVSSWTTISTNTIPPGGLFEFIDSNAPPAEMRFYRTRLH